MPVPYRSSYVYILDDSGAVVGNISLAWQAQRSSNEWSLHYTAGTEIVKVDGEIRDMQRWGRYCITARNKFS